MPNPRIPRIRADASTAAGSEPLVKPMSWGGAFVSMAALAGVLWVVEIVNALDNYGLNRFGLRPREVGGLWGILAGPFLHASAWHLLSNTGPFIALGWVVLLSGVRTWLVVTGLVALIGGVVTWLLAPSGLVIGCSGLIFGWLGYLLARAYFSRRFVWILAAVLVAFFFGGLFAGLIPTINSESSWQAHVCSFAAGVATGWLLHPRGERAPRRASVS